MDCPRCQQDNAIGQKFCGECGTSFRATSEGSLPGGSYGELQRELSQAREQQTATAEILRVISNSPTDVQLVLETIVNSAPRLCGGEVLHPVSVRRGAPAPGRPPQRAWRTPRDDLKRYGEYRTARVIIEIYDAMAKAIATGQPYRTILDLPPADPRCCHPPREAARTKM